MATTPFTFTSEGVGTVSTKQWDRQCSLIVGDNSGKALDLSALEVKFAVSSATQQTLKKLECRIYNPSPTTVQKIRSEFTRVQLSVAYEDQPLKLLFNGLITFIRTGKENGVDSFLDVEAADSDEGYNWATVSVPLPAGSNSLNDQLQAVLDALRPFGITAGYIPDLSKLNDNATPGTLASGQWYIPGALPRGKVMYGSAKNLLRQIAASANCFWFIDNGALIMFPTNSWIPGGTIVINTSSGMVGSPVQTFDGLQVRSLLNTNIHTGSLIRVDSADIQATDFRTDVPQVDFSNGQVFGQRALQPGLDRSGFYVVYKLVETGDTRADEWYSDMVCAAVDPTNGVQPVTDTFRQKIIGEA